MMLFSMPVSIAFIYRRYYKDQGRAVLDKMSEVSVGWWNDVYVIGVVCLSFASLSFIRKADAPMHVLIHFGVILALAYPIFLKIKNWKG